MTTKVPRWKKPRYEKRFAILGWDEEHDTIKFPPFDTLQSGNYVLVVWPYLEILTKGEGRLCDTILAEATLKKARE